jgi:hypothetical protein
MLMDLYKIVVVFSEQLKPGSKLLVSIALPNDRRAIKGSSLWMLRFCHPGV